MRRDFADRLPDQRRHEYVVFQRNQHAARFARVLSVVRGPALLDDYRALDATHRAGRTPARHETRSATQTASRAPASVLAGDLAIHVAAVATKSRKHESSFSRI